MTPPNTLDCPTAYDQFWVAVEDTSRSADPNAPADAYAEFDAALDG